MSGQDGDFRRQRLAGTTLCVLVDGGSSAEACGRLVSKLAAAGVGMIQLREKSPDDAALLARAQAAVGAARPHGTLVIVNDRADIAFAADADGVHLGEHDLPVADARRLLGEDRLIGRTAHTLEEAVAAHRSGADYLGVGPCFPSDTKAFAAFAPREFLAAVAREIPLPSFAIGGITLDRLPQVLLLGLTRVAVAAGVTAATDPVAAVVAYLRGLAGR
jgi:thiamine-phosphate pyrophosphorylase